MIELKIAIRSAQNNNINPIYHLKGDDHFLQNFFIEKICDSLFKGEKINKSFLVPNEMAGKEYSFIKSKLADLLISEISPVGKEINKLMNDKAYLLQILKKGTEKASIKAEENLKNIREKVGLI